MDHREITLKYYSHWAGINIDSVPEGVEFVSCDERNKIQDGYDSCFDLWIWIDDKRTIVSYGLRAEEKIPLLKTNIDRMRDSQELFPLLKDVCGDGISHGIKYLYCGGKYKSGRAQILQEKDYTLYEAFFRKCHPGCRDVSWLKDYFEEMLAANMCCGVVEEDKLVSCTDAPIMPYMSEEVQEIGVNTLAEYYGRHFATDCCKLCAEQILKSGKSPQWSTDIDNVSSQKVAENIGFQKLGEYMGIRLKAL